MNPTQTFINRLSYSFYYLAGAGSSLVLLLVVAGLITRGFRLCLASKETPRPAARAKPAPLKPSGGSGQAPL
ncbi:MAG: hypothetical protein JWP00_2365 [Chloroflexi bacterium]|nr:hypothetical protein [Chloroflexota bacterium]